MTIKKLIATLGIASVLMMGGIAISAQEAPTDAPPVTEEGAPPHERGPRHERDEAMQALVETYTGLDHEALREALQAEGTTLASLIEANGQSVEAFIAEAIALKEAQINERLANGDITAEQAAEKLAQVEERITERVNSEFEARRPDGRRDRGPRGNRPGPDGEQPPAPQDAPQSAPQGEADSADL